jgi:hypothetical protein
LFSDVRECSHHNFWRSGRYCSSYYCLRSSNSAFSWGVSRVVVGGLVSILQTVKSEKKHKTYRLLFARAGGNCSRKVKQRSTKRRKRKPLCFEILDGTQSLKQKKRMKLRRKGNLPQLDAPCTTRNPPYYQMQKNTTFVYKKRGDKLRWYIRPSCLLQNKIFFFLFQVENITVSWRTQKIGFVGNETFESRCFPSLRGKIHKVHFLSFIHSVDWLSTKNVQKNWDSW